MTTLQDLKLSQIKPHKLNPRRELGDLTELAASIAEKGIVQPIVVAPGGAADSYTLLFGHRRHAAAKLAKCKTVPCILREDLTDPKAQLEVMLIENLQRSDLSPMEEAEAYQQLLTFPGYTQKRIVEATGRTAATVRARLKLAKLPAPAQAKVHAGQISIHDAGVMVEFADEPETFRKLESAIGTNNFGYYVQRAKEDRSREKLNAKTRAELEAAEVRIVDAPTWQTEHVRLEPEEVEDHRSCPGFAAYLTYSGSASYICDQPGLHPSDDDEDDELPVNDQEYRATMAALEADAQSRREHLGRTLRDADESLALDILRGRVGKAAKTVPWLADVFGLRNDSNVPAAVTRKVHDLDLIQLTVVLDLIQHDNDERSLERSSGWGDQYSDYTAKWRTRLTETYGYEWTEHELQMIAAAEAKRTPAEPTRVDTYGDDQAGAGE